MMKRELIMTGMVRQVLRMLHSMTLTMRCRCRSAMEVPSALVDSRLTFHASRTETIRTELL